MEPELIVIEECNRFFIVQQRMGMDHPTKGASDSWTPTNRHEQAFMFPCAYIFTVMNGPYSRIYREWVRYDNRKRHADMQFGYIVEARNKRQVVEEMNRRGHAAMFNSKFYYPHNDKEGYIMNYADYDGYRRGAALAGHTTAVTSLSKLQDALLRQAAEVQAKIDYLDSLPKEPVWDDDKPNVIYFQKQFSEGGRFFDYAAIKAGDGLWYTTGPRTPKGFTWQQLIEWIDEGHWPILSRATKFKAL